MPRPGERNTLVPVFIARPLVGPRSARDVCRSSGRLCEEVVEYYNNSSLLGQIYRLVDPIRWEASARQQPIDGDLVRHLARVNNRNSNIRTVSVNSPSTAHSGHSRSVVAQVAHPTINSRLGHRPQSGADTLGDSPHQDGSMVVQVHVEKEKVPQ